MAGIATLDAMDSASAALILQILETDSEELLANSKGKGKEGEILDRDLATGLFLEEIREKKVMVSDQAMSRSITRAVITDANVLTNFTTEEQAAAQDRTVALNMSGRSRTEVRPQPATHNPLATDENLVARLLGVYVLPVGTPGESSTGVFVGDDDDMESAGPSLHWSMSKQAASAPALCTACNSSEVLYKSYKAPCGHFYCEECLERLFQLSATDESLFPPRCCRQQIPVESAKLYLSKETIDQFVKKSAEFGTPNRSYCFKPTCSSFIPTSSIDGDTGVCPKCGASTCTICKGESHTNDCPQDTTTQEVLELATREGWQRCFNCKRLVELNIGCNHMSCLCGKEFCYRCGLKWKTCPCARWDESRLLVSAQQYANRRGRLFPQERNQEQGLEQVMEHLRQRPACQHTEWQFTEGEYQCEWCLDHLSHHIFECTRCHIQICNRCRRNRL